MRRLLFLFPFFGCCLAVPAAEPVPARPLLEWNEQVLTVAEAEDAFLTLKGLRTATMMHIAVHDALANIRGRYRPYLYEGDGRNAAALAALAQAAHAVATRQYPDQGVRFGALRDRQLAAVTDAASREAGIALGEVAAQAILADREADGWDTEAAYQWHPMAPGVYAEFNEHSGTPEGFIFGAGWAQAKPFALERPDQFRSPPPPAIGSAEYTRAYSEVRDVGRYQTLERTPDQGHLALWWKDFAENSHNRLARRLVVREQLGLEDAARLFALLNMAIYDSYVSVFDNKFYYNHWRPFTAIRWAANDGNPDTVPDETWDNLHRHTYAFPSYPSAHGAACAAAMSALEDVFGASYAFTMRTPLVDSAGPLSPKIRMLPPTRSFDSFDAAAEECAQSRIYLGIHFRYDATAGTALGRHIGRHVVGNYLESRR
jgi:membrane-associated phospholipid phosphatase